MDAKMRIFCRIDGVDYFDWTLYGDIPHWSFIKLKHKERQVVLDKGLLNDLSKGNPKLFDNTFTPNYGSEIHLVSGCPVGVADVRKNYTLKRKPDDGTCNVFSPLKKSADWISNTGGYAIIPSEKAIVISCKNEYNKERMDIYQAVQHFFPDLLKIKDPVPIMPGVDVWKNKELNLYYLEIPEAYLSLLKGELKKPCISYEKLEFKTDNEVNLDILYLVYKTGKAACDMNSRSAFNIQLHALNEHNWRDYPGTLNVLIHDMLRREIDSGLPKAIQEMVKCGMAAQTPFKSQKDLEMAQKLIKYVVDIPDDMQFSSIQEILSKFREKSIDRDVFFRLFDNIVKFRPKEFKNES